MVTKYDVFAKIIEKAPCSQKELMFASPVYAHLRALEKDGFIKKSRNKYIPVKTKKSTHIFNIVKFCLNNGVNYNIFFSKDIPKILKELYKNTPNMRPKALKNNEQILKVLKFFEESQFILLRKIKPRRGTLLNNTIFREIMDIHNLPIEPKETFASYKEIKQQVLQIPLTEANPFERNYFEFITGSAQLEGSTLSIGETIELLTKEIYPQKKHIDIQMVKNLNEAAQFVLQNLNEKVTSEHIKEVNKRVLFSLHKGAGKFKIAQNRIHGNPNFKTTSPSLVPKEVEEFCDMFNSIKSREKALDAVGEIHNTIQGIHPFPDGNSRTSRLITNWLLMKFRFPLHVLKAGSFEKYMSLTKLSSKRADESLRQFLLHVLYHEHLTE